MKPDDKTIDKLAKVMMHVTNDAFEQASRTAVLICFALKFVLAAGVYMAIRYVGQQALADLFMLVVFAFGIYGNELYISMKVKESIVRKALEEEVNAHEEKDADIEKDSKDTEK